jgi:hypothetical protein
MILYVNGDSHSAGAEAVNTYCFAEDDSQYRKLGRRPHPDNLAVSYGQILANKMNCTLYCDAESASSNHRIIRTAWNYVTARHERAPQHADFVVIGWSTWERKEFNDPATGINWQVNAGGVGVDWPQWLKDQYPKFISELDWGNELRQSHSKIHQFHLDLKRRGIRHLFFNTYSHFDSGQLGHTYTWDNCYLEPYNPRGTYYEWCLARGFKPVRDNGYHFGANAHAAWAEHLYTQIVQMCLTHKE